MKHGTYLPLTLQVRAFADPVANFHAGQRPEADVAMFGSDMGLGLIFHARVSRRLTCVIVFEAFELIFGAITI